MSSFDDISTMFNTESEKLENLINIAATKSELTMHEIVDTYYQVMNISSMTAMLKQQLNSDEHKTLLETINETEKIISEKFNTHIHPKILEQLTNSIQEMTKNLQSSTGDKSKEEIENESKSYEELRKQMSTKEFVEQYAQGLT